MEVRQGELEEEMLTGEQRTQSNVDTGTRTTQDQPGHNYFKFMGSV